MRLGEKMESLIMLSFVGDVGVPTPASHWGQDEGRASARFPWSIGQCEARCGLVPVWTWRECTHVWGRTPLWRGGRGECEEGSHTLLTSQQMAMRTLKNNLALSSKDEGHNSTTLIFRDRSERSILMSKQGDHPVWRHHFNILSNSKKKKKGKRDPKYPIGEWISKF